ncbi:MAG: hypothetical protein Q9163_004085 [Psora crenata]
MADTISQLNGFFATGSISELAPEVLGELQSILRLHSLSPQELFYKWESYTMKMGPESTKINLDTIRAFKKDLQEMLERDSRGKMGRSVEKVGRYATPRGNGAREREDIFGMLDGVTPSTPLQDRSANGPTKRKVPYETPVVPKSRNGEGMSPSIDARGHGNVTSASTAPFDARQNAGQIIETLNDHIVPFEAPIAPPAEPRVKLTANTDLKKFYYKPMAMHLSEASEILDDRIDEFQALIKSHHNLDDFAFGSAASQSTNEVVAVGRIACDSPEGKLNAASLMLETSRRTGAGRRVPLKVDSVSYEFFPGQIVAVRGINASGTYFSVSEILDFPLPPPGVSAPSTLDIFNERVGVEDGDVVNPSNVLNFMIASGPYTADDNLAFEPLNTLCEKAAESYADVLIMVGPILDIEHPHLASGDFDLPDDPSVQPDKATLDDVFRILVGTPLRLLAQQIPSITIILVPSVRDVVNKHVSWPQEPFDKKVLGLPKQARMVTNPVTISLNETLVGISAQDVLWDLRREEVLIGNSKENSLLARLPRYLIQQRHFYPLFPPGDKTASPTTGTDKRLTIGMPLDVSYLKLGEWVNARPDLLITPSALPPFAKVVESVLVINPGSLSKRKGPGTYAQLAVHPRKILDEEREAEVVGHHLFDRTRVDVVRI